MRMVYIHEKPAEYKERATSVLLQYEYVTNLYFGEISI